MYNLEYLDHCPYNVGNVEREKIISLEVKFEFCLKSIKKKCLKMNIKFLSVNIIFNIQILELHFLTDKYQ